ncbi:alanine--tRNA ligase [Dehalococcoidia bacterium]|nr:alanine--tRNA ligase [Dehalococcoidia bacterium]
MNSNEIRDAFLRFFAEKGHTVSPSSSLVPHGDPTLLLTSAGVVQFMPYFMGEATPPSPRLVSCQKCFRATDVDSVGDAGHLTFFEMLGNFSVGDYFKKEAIAWAWEFVTERLHLPEERLWITIFLDDDEAFDHWLDIGVPRERIVRCGEEDNFWGPPGDSGPCGPCSEILYDFGEESGCGKPECGPACNCGRFSEIWNLVFTQYYQDERGNRTPLPRTNIDTGMGLERTAAIMQGKSSVYETDLFMPLIERISVMTGHRYDESETIKRAMRVVAEHGRAVAFLIADGVIPSNDGRGYVLRRVLRRAALFGKKLGLDEPFLSEIAKVAIEQMRGIYPELATSRDYIISMIDLEESKFDQTLNTGMGLLDEIMARARENGLSMVPGEQVFRLYDTYGFPKEITAEIAAENGLSIDLEGFEKEMERQRERARAAHRFGGDTGQSEESAVVVRYPPVHFVGYDKLSHEARIAVLLAGGKQVNTASRGQEVEVTLYETPFYGEMGGQVGDTGEVKGPQGKVVITSAIRQADDLVVHLGRVEEGTVSVGDSVEAKVDFERRLDIARNHTATHLLQAALRQVLGDQVRQAGSLVAPNYFRFDFTHLIALSKGELAEIQHIVNENIRRNLPVFSRVAPYSQAMAEGALAFFGEKYADQVRVLEIKAPHSSATVSVELCGGTHVRSTGEIGFFNITSERSIGSGMRRIEAVTGRAAEALIAERLAALDAVAGQLETSPSEVGGKLAALIAEFNAERKRARGLESRLLRETAESLLREVKQIDGVNVLAARVSASNMELLRQMGDWLKDKLGSAVIVLGIVRDGNPRFLAMVTPDLVARGIHAGDIVKQVAQVTGGGGGGKADIGQAGGRDKSKIDEALRLVPELVRKG